MNRIFRFLTISLCTIGLSLPLSAASKDKVPTKDMQRPPLGCYPKGYYFDLKTLNLLAERDHDIQALYFFQNRLKVPIRLYQMRSDDTPEMIYLNQTIPPQQWAALSISAKKAMFLCTIPDKNSSYGKIVNCADGLQVCSYTNARYGLNNRGNYWLPNMGTSGEVVQSVIRYGMIPAL